MAGVGGWGRIDVRLTRIIAAAAAVSAGLLLMAGPAVAGATPVFGAPTRLGSDAWTAVSCTGRGDCTAVNPGNGIVSYSATETNGVWGDPTALPTAPDGFSQYWGVSCAGAGDCTAVGNDGYHGIYAVETNGVWDATATEIDDAYFGELNGISCSDATDCTAVGFAQVEPAHYVTADVVTESGGVWGAAVVFPLPLIPGLNVQQVRFSGVSCVDARDCTAVGYAFSAGGVDFPLVAGESSGVWSDPVVSLAGPGDVLNGVSCTGPGDCTAVGDNPGVLGIDDTETDGVWATPARVQGTSFLNGVSCSDASDCVAVGQESAGQTSAYAVETDGVWSNAIVDSAGTDGSVGAQFTGVSCSDRTDCTAVGGLYGGGGMVASTLFSPSVTVSDNSSGLPVGGTLTFTATVTGTGGVTPTGAMSWTVTAPGGGTPSCDSTSGPTGSSDVATYTCSIDNTTAGSYSAKADYPGDSNYEPNSGSDTSAFVNGVSNPDLTVTVTASGPYGSAPRVTGLAHGDSAIGYSPSSEAANVTGTLSCSTTATSSSGVGSYPISGCSGLVDSGFNVVYDYAHSGYSVTKAPLTVTADDQSRLFGSANPPLTATLSGFVLGQTLTTSGVSGAALCTTTAMAFSPGGGYPITCTLGGLTAANYRFAPFVPGTLTVTYSGACITKTVSSALAVSAGQAICVGSGGKVSGPVTVNAGGRLDLEGGTIAGPLTSKGAVLVRLCGGTVTGPLTISGSTGLVLVGGDAATGACPGNTITGPASVTGNTGGVEFNGNKVTGPLTITGNSGSLPPPDTGPVHVVGNTVSGKVKIQP